MRNTNQNNNTAKDFRRSSPSQRNSIRHCVSSVYCWICTIFKIQPLLWRWNIIMRRLKAGTLTLTSANVETLNTRAQERIWRHCQSSEHYSFVFSSWRLWGHCFVYKKWALVWLPHHLTASLRTFLNMKSLNDCNKPVYETKTPLSPNAAQFA